MGSRAVAIVCRSEEAALKRFGVGGEGIGIVYTRTGRPFFNEKALEQELLVRLRAQIDAAGIWDELETDWLCLDCELMPWSAKAQSLIVDQYASVGAAGRAQSASLVAALEGAAARGVEIGGRLEEAVLRASLVDAYTDAYRGYCWPVQSVDDMKLAPFHLLASEGKVHIDKAHDWHMAVLARLAGGIVPATPHLLVDLTDEDHEKKAVDWWIQLTGRGGEGMVVKPMDFVPRGTRGLAQPAVKCRGREYLRIIYGPEYTLPENLSRLRSRGLGAKRSLAMREFVLGIEALERFVRREPLRRVHECVFGVLALESEPVDPRL